MEGCSRKCGSSFSTSKKILVSFCNVCLNVKSKMGSCFNLCFVFQLVSWLLVSGLFFFFLTVVRALFQIYTLCVGQKIEYSVWRRKWIIYISCMRTWLSLSLRIYALGNLSKKKKSHSFGFLLFILSYIILELSSPCRNMGQGMYRILVAFPVNVFYVILLYKTPGFDSMLKQLSGACDRWLSVLCPLFAHVC